MVASVIAAYQGLASYTNADAASFATYPAEVSVTLGTAPADGDVVLVLWSTVGYIVQPSTDWQTRDLPGSAYSGCNLSGWQRGFFYNTTADAGTTRYDDMGVAATSGGIGIGTTVFMCRATSAATAGTLTFDIAWTGPVPAAARSVAVTVLYLRGLPDLGPDLSYTLLPRREYDPPHGFYGQSFIGSATTLASGDWPVDSDQIFSSSLEGFGYSDPVTAKYGYPVLPGQVFVGIGVGDHTGDLFPADTVGGLTVLPSQNLGLVTTGATRAGIVTIGYAAPSTQTWYTFGLDSTDRPAALVACIGLVIGPGSPEKSGIPITTGTTPLASSRIGYHSLSAIQEVALPPSAAAGDLVALIAADRYLPGYPTGWTSYLTRSGTNQSARMSWKVLTSTDVTTGTVSYTTAQPGTGGYVILSWKAGSFRTGSPFMGEADSIAADINEAMPYLVVNAGQSIYHYAHGRTAAPGHALSSRGSLVAARTADPDSISALYVETATSDTTLNTVWTADVATTGSFKISFTLNPPPAATVWGPQWTATAALMVAAYEAVPISPDPDEILYDTGPTLVALVDGSPSPFSVQFQTSATTSFGSILWSQTLTGQVPGEVSATVGVALVANTVSYWRVRAGDGTSWGPWSTAQPLRPMLQLTDAREYLHLNVGAELVTVANPGEYMHNNVGLPDTPASIGADYLHQNVGFQVVLDRRGGDYLHENVFVGTPVPHLWFCWLEYGFANDHVFLVGQGLGTLMTEYNATIRLLDKSGATVVSHTCSVFDWSVNPAGVHAYDALRRIYKGSDAAPYDVTQEADVVEIIVPTGAVPVSAQTDYFVAQTNGGTSNELPFLIYPLIPTPMEGSAGTSRSGSSVTVDPYQPTTTPIEQIHIAFTPAAVTVVGGMLERPPATLVTARSTFMLNSTSATADLEDPVSLPVALGARWRPLSSSITPRPDLGTGVSLWEPLSGSENAWKIVNGSDPYVDATYDVITRNGVYGRPAMIFPGDAWVELTEALPLNAVDSTTLGFTAVVVATLYPSAGAVLATALDTGQPVGTQPLSIELRGDQLGVYYGVSANPVLSAQIPGDYLSRRPVIIALSLDLDPVAAAANQYVLVGRLTVVAASSVSRSTSLQPVANTSRLWMGRQTDLGHGIQRMDVLDVAIGTVLTKAEEAAVITAYDSAYGVSQP